MKIRTPYYYKDFCCIAGKCTDTCCAGWDVDVDEASYQYYKTVGGAFGKRLQDVMVPEQDGGCTFTLQENKRCPFLNSENLCDLFTELGEDKLCDTCAEFPRFINEYGSEREIGLAPSCITAGEIMFAYQESLTFTVEENDERVSSYNDIDPQLYFHLRQARVTAYNIIRNRAFRIEERVALYLDFTQKLQKKINKDRVDLFSYEIEQYANEAYLKKRLAALKKELQKQPADYAVMAHYFDTFPDMEVINPDWYGCLKEIAVFFEKYDNRQSANRMVTFMEKYRDKEYEFEQLMMYYVYRYFLNAVYDADVLLKGKIGVIGFLILRQLDTARWDANGEQFAFNEQVDLAHLYSRQLEHSYTNFAYYNEIFNKKRMYSVRQLLSLLFA